MPKMEIVRKQRRVVASNHEMVMTKSFIFAMKCHPLTLQRPGFFFPILEVLNTYKKSSEVTLCGMYTSTCALSLSHPLPSLLNHSSSMLLKLNCNLG